MLPELTAMEWVSVTSLSLSLSALAARFLTKEEKVSARAHLLSAVVALSLLSAALGAIHSFKRAAEIAALADEIYFVLGNQQKTTDQIIVELGLQQESNFTAAIAALKSKHSIESEVKQIQIHGGRPNAVRVWRALANK